MVLSGCGEQPNPPNTYVQNYLSALGSGEFTTACGTVDPQAMAALIHKKRVHLSCATFFKRCLPNNAIVLKSDQTQLLYANINVSLRDNGTIADADTSATRVATELKHVTLKHEHGTWKLIGFGRVFDACRPNAHKRKPKHHSQHKQ